MTIEAAIDTVIVNERRAGCGRRKIACVILDDRDSIIGEGLNGPIGSECLCPAKHSEPGTGPADCYGVHAEIKALMNVHGFYGNLRPCRTLISTKAPCLACVRVLLGTPIQTIIFLIPSNETENREKWETAGRSWIDWPAEEDL